MLRNNFVVGIFPDLCQVCPPFPTPSLLLWSPPGPPRAQPPLRPDLADQYQTLTLTAAPPHRHAERAPARTTDTSEDEQLSSKQEKHFFFPQHAFCNRIFLFPICPLRVLPDLPRGSPITVRQEPPRRVNSPLRVPPPGQRTHKHLLYFVMVHIMSNVWQCFDNILPHLVAADQVSTVR